MSDRLYLLDTSVLLALVRGSDLGRQIDQTFGLGSSRLRPLICVVTHGEIRALARRNKWGEDKTASLETMLANLVTVDINHPTVIEAYVEIDLFSSAHPSGSINMGKNDLWIAACARAAEAYLLTCDDDFGHLFGKLVEGECIEQGASPSRP